MTKKKQESGTKLREVTTIKATPDKGKAIQDQRLKALIAEINNYGNDSPQPSNNSDDLPPAA